MFAMVSKFIVALLLSAGLCQAAHYLPGVSPNAFQDGEQVRNVVLSMILDTEFQLYFPPYISVRSL